jgi:hypothetical protein
MHVASTNSQQKHVFEASKWVQLTEKQVLAAVWFRSRRMNGASWHSAPSTKTCKKTCTS